MARPGIHSTPAASSSSRPRLTAGAAATLSFPAPAPGPAAQARLLVLPVPEGERRRAGELRQGVGEEEQRRPPDLDGPVEGVHAEDHRGHRGQGDPRRRRVGRRGAARRGQLLDVTDIYKKLEKTHGGWVGPSSKFMLEPDGRVHTILYGLQGFMLVGRDDLVKAGRAHAAARRRGSTCSPTPRRCSSPRRRSGSGIPVSNQTDSQVWEDIMKSYGARLADRGGQADHPRRLQEGDVGVPRLLHRGLEGGRAPPRRHHVGQHDEQLDLPVRQGRVRPQPDHDLAVARGEQPRAPGQDGTLHVPARAEGADPAAHVRLPLDHEVHEGARPGEAVPPGLDGPRQDEQGDARSASGARC